MKIEDLKKHMIIEAFSREEAFNIAQEELDILHKVLRSEAKKAKVSAYNLNEKGFRYYEDKMGDRDLIIENAGQLKNQVIDDIEEYIIKNTKKNILALIDIINNFDKLAKERPSFVERFDIYSVLSENRQEAIDDSDIEKDFGERIKEEKIEREERREIDLDFEKEKTWPENIQVEKIEIENNQANTNQINTSQINIEKAASSRENNIQLKRPEEPKEQERQIKKVNDMNVDDFVEYCKSYAKSIDCALPGKTIPALYECIEDMVERGMALTEKRAIDLIEGAADKAEKPRLFYKPRYDKDGALVLLEEHFLDKQ